MLLSSSPLSARGEGGILISVCHIDGDKNGDDSGFSVSLSGNGNIVAIGAPDDDGGSSNTGDNRGCVKVYEYDNQVKNIHLYQIESILTDEFGSFRGRSVLEKITSIRFSA